MTSIQVKTAEVRGAVTVTLLGIEEARLKAVQEEAERRMKQWFFKPSSLDVAFIEVAGEDEYRLMYGNQQDTCKRLIHMADASASDMMSLSDHDFDAIREHMRTF